MLLFVHEIVWRRRGGHGVVKVTTHYFAFLKHAALYVVLVTSVLSRALSLKIYAKQKLSQIPDWEERRFVRVSGRKSLVGNDTELPPYF